MRRRLEAAVVWPGVLGGRALLAAAAPCQATGTRSELSGMCLPPCSTSKIINFVLNSSVACLRWDCNLDVWRVSVPARSSPSFAWRAVVAAHRQPA